MALKKSIAREGKLLVLEHTSRVLQGNALGDPHVRKLAVWLPAEYDEGASRGRGKRFPVLFDLVGFTGSGLAHAGWKPFGPNVPERVARLIHERKMPPVILVFPDCFTRLGGNQYVNSSAIGRYGDYLVKELVPFVDRELRTLASRDHRGCFGKSSGGYGAIVHAMKYAKTWGAIADHSGDAYFDMVYRTGWPETLDLLMKHRTPKRVEGAFDVRAAVRSKKMLAEGKDDGRVEAFLNSVWKKEKLSMAEGHAIMNVCMAATYDPDPKAPLGFRLPFHLETGALLEDRWKRWLVHDPVHMVPHYEKELASTRGIYVDTGWSDQYFIHYGARQLSLALAEAGIKHRYEEFPDNHSDIDYRMNVSLPFLAKALA